KRLNCFQRGLLVDGKRPALHVPLVTQEDLHPLSLAFEHAPVQIGLGKRHRLLESTEVLVTMRFELVDELGSEAVGDAAEDVALPMKGPAKCWVSLRSEELK